MVLRAWPLLHLQSQQCRISDLLPGRPPSEPAAGLPPLHPALQKMEDTLPSLTSADDLDPICVLNSPLLHEGLCCSVVRTQVSLQPSVSLVQMSPGQGLAQWPRG